MLQMTLDRYRFPQNDYGRNISFKIYDEDGLVFNCNGYTPELIVLNWNRSQFIDQITPTWTNQSQGEGTFKFTKEKRLDRPDFYFLEIQLTKADEQTSTELRRISGIHSGD